MASTGRPSVPRYRTPPVSLRQLAIAHSDQLQQVTWRHGTWASRGNPDAAMTSWFAAAALSDLQVRATELDSRSRLSA